MAKDFSKYNDENPVMAILEKAKKEEEAKTDSVTVVQQNNYAASISEPQEPPKAEEIKKILMNISIRETTKKEWKMFFLEHDLSMTQGIETAVEYLMSEVRKNNIKLSKGGITKQKVMNDVCTRRKAYSPG